MSVILTKEIAGLQLTWTQFYPTSVVIFSALGIITTIFSLIYFNRKFRELTPDKEK